MDYGQDFDFTKTFFEQFKQLWDKVPKLGLLTLGDMTNSDYCHDAMRLANCYLIFDGEQAKNCFYGETFSNVEDCCDFLFVQRCTLCYEVLNCNDCNDVNFSRYSYNCSNSNFLVNCQGCHDCFGCINLKQKRNHIFNRPYAPEEYKKAMAAIELGDYQTLQKIKKQVNEFFQKFPRKHLNGIMNENVTGDNLISCKDTFESYDCANLRDCKYCTNMFMGANDCYDVNIWGDNLNLAYNSAGIGAGGQNIIGSYLVAFGAQDVFHSIFCLNDVGNLFGCVALSHKRNCILNKEYSEEQYKKTSSLIIEHMKKTCEWGEFFPPSLSAFGYNETVADEYYPISKDLAPSHRFKWHNPDPREYQIQTYKTPEKIKNVSQDITKEILACEHCQKNFKIIAQELKYYQSKSLPLPRKCPNCRHKDRLGLRNPRQLFTRNCGKCNQELKTAYSPDRPEIVYCENCYLKEVY